MALNILITNDDGAGAAQLVPLIRWCKKLGNVTTVVPKFEQSGKSHGIELHTHFEAKQVQLAADITAWTVDSTPADCVRFAILGLKYKFDLVISGVNRGFNIGTDVMYSGTVGAASEANLLGVKAIAISTSPEYYDSAIAHLDRVFDFIEKHKLLDIGSIFNVNIPPSPRKILITKQGGEFYSDEFLQVEKNLFRPTGKCVYVDKNDNTLDTDAVMHGFISITPLTIVRTDMSLYERLKALSE